jgi:hypothetical protein
MYAGYFEVNRRNQNCKHQPLGNSSPKVSSSFRRVEITAYNALLPSVVVRRAKRCFTAEALPYLLRMEAELQQRGTEPPLPLICSQVQLSNRAATSKFTTSQALNLHEVSHGYLYGRRSRLHFGPSASLSLTPDRWCSRDAVPVHRAFGWPKQCCRSS